MTWTLVVLSIGSLFMGEDQHPRVTWIAEGYRNEGLSIDQCLVHAEFEAQQAENFTVQCVNVSTGERVTIK